MHFQPSLSLVGHILFEKLLYFWIRIFTRVSYLITLRFFLIFSSSTWDFWNNSDNSEVAHRLLEGLAIVFLLINAHITAGGQNVVLYFQFFE